MKYTIIVNEENPIKESLQNIIEFFFTSPLLADTGKEKRIKNKKIIIIFFILPP